MAQPKPRHLPKLAASLGIPYRTVAQWASWYGWRERVLAHDNRLIEAAQREQDEERATTAVLKGTYQAIKHTMASYIETVRKRQEAGAPVTEANLFTAMKVLEMLHSQYADVLSEAEPTP